MPIEIADLRKLAAVSRNLANFAKDGETRLSLSILADEYESKAALREEELNRLSERFSPMTNDSKIYNEPSETKADEGSVHVEGPDGVDVKLTPDAALETSDRLLESAAKARGQQVRKGRDWQR